MSSRDSAGSHAFLEGEQEDRARALEVSFPPSLSLSRARALSLSLSLSQTHSLSISPSLSLLRQRYSWTQRWRPCAGHIALFEEGSVSTQAESLKAEA